MPCFWYLYSSRCPDHVQLLRQGQLELGPGGAVYSLGKGYALHILSWVMITFFFLLSSPQNAPSNYLFLVLLMQTVPCQEWILGKFGTIITALVYWSLWSHTRQGRGKKNLNPCINKGLGAYKAVQRESEYYKAWLLRKENPWQGINIKPCGKGTEVEGGMIRLLRKKL